VQWPGPRSTPTIVDGRVYTLGQHGQLNAWDVGDGKSVWSVQLAESYNPDVDYGFAWSPLVMGDHLILGCGRGGLAIRTSDGAYAWGNDGQHGACASPVPFTHDGRVGVAVVVTDQGRDGVSLIGVDPRDGKRMWREGPWPEKWGAACVDPVIADGKLFMTTAEQHLECARFTIGDGKLALDWSSKELPCYTGGCVQLGDCLYGVNKHGILKCLDWETGKLLWAERGFGGHGTMIAADGALVVQSSKGGDVVVVAAEREGYRELRRIQPFEGETDTFTAPVLANGRLYVRSYAGEVVCLDVTQ
jgi:outer membrane protein assembly factor BamB